jgi:DNA-binding Lrp family transcriptional regulator
MKANILLFLCCIIALYYAYTKHVQAGETKPNDTLVVHDTAWQIHDSIVVRKVPVYKEVRVEIASRPEMLPDTNYANLKRQYEALLTLFLNQRIYSDTIKIGSYGYVAVLDTIKENKLASRRTQENYKIPIVKETKTITKYAPPVRNLFVGGGITTSNSLGIRGVEAGIIYKTKKDALFNAKASVDLNGSPLYGFGYYYKLK